MKMNPLRRLGLDIFSGCVLAFISFWLYNLVKVVEVNQSTVQEQISSLSMPPAWFLVLVFILGVLAFEALAAHMLNKFNQLERTQKKAHSRSGYPLKSSGVKIKHDDYTRNSYDGSLDNPYLWFVQLTGYTDEEDKPGVDGSPGSYSSHHNYHSSSHDSPSHSHDSSGGGYSGGGDSGGGYGGGSDSGGGGGDGGGGGGGE